MATSDFITAGLRRQLDICLLPTRQRRTRQRWDAHPALRGRGVADAAGVVADTQHPDHNRVAAALLRAHCADPHPGDEMVLLLNAARPMVLLIDRAGRHHDSRATVWSAAIHRLSALDPDDVDHHHVPFLIHLLGHIRYLPTGIAASPARRPLGCR